MQGYFAFNTAMIPWVSSKLKVVCVRYATREGSGTFRLWTSSSELINHVCHRGFAQRSDHFIVIFVPDQNDGKSLADKPNRLQVHLGNQGTCGVNHLQAPLGRHAPNLGRNAMSAEDDPGSLRHILDRIEEKRPFAGKVQDHVVVVDDFLPSRKWARRKYPEQYLQYQSRGPRPRKSLWASKEQLSWEVAKGLVRRLSYKNFGPAKDSTGFRASLT